MKVISFRSIRTSFDLIIATSIFTHLQPGAAQNYIFQCARFLETGGRLFATFYLLENGHCPGWHSSNLLMRLAVLRPPRNR